jgi:hypothetical protein
MDTRSTKRASAEPPPVTPADFWRRLLLDFTEENLLAAAGTDVEDYVTPESAKRVCRNHKKHGPTWDASSGFNSHAYWIYVDGSFMGGCHWADMEHEKKVYLAGGNTPEFDTAPRNFKELHEHIETLFFSISDDDVVISDDWIFDSSSDSYTEGREKRRRLNRENKKRAKK